MQLITWILLLYATLSVHELGHYISAKLCGMHIYELCIGMGPVLLRKRSRHTGTVFVLRLLPFRGYTRLFRIHDIHRRRTGRKKAFESQPHWKQAVVIAAGSIANFAGAIIMMCCQRFFGADKMAEVGYCSIIMILCAVCNLIPIGKTDGAKLLKLFRQAK